MKKTYTILSAACENEYQEKKSRFIAQLAPASNKDHVSALLERAKLRYPDARHHCSAYLIGDPNQAIAAGFSDDGEPGGTAGKPMLNVLMQRAVGDVAVIVSRYFGGIKLGAGGLVRAYGQAVSDALNIAQLEQIVPVIPLGIVIDYPFESACRRILEQYDAHDITAHYHQKVTLRSTVAYDLEEQIEHSLREHCAGNIEFLSPDGLADQA